MSQWETLQTRILAVGKVAFPARMDVSWSAAGGDTGGNCVAGGRGRGAGFGKLRVVFVPACGDFGDGVVNCRPGFEPRLGGEPRVSGFWEGREDFAGTDGFGD